MLLAELYKRDAADELLKEADSMVEKRRELNKMIGALMKAEEIINTV